VTNTRFVSAAWLDWPTRDGLVGVRSKLLRADNHLEELGDFLGEHFAKEAHVLSAEIHVEPEPGMRIRGQIQPPSVKSSVIIGDFVQNLHAALDHLACRLIEKHNIRKLSDDELAKVVNGTFFPMMQDPPTANAQGVPGPLAIARHVLPDAAKIITDVQPYGWGTDVDLHPLLILRKMSNADKHQQIHFTVVKGQSVTSIGELRPVSGRLVTTTILDDGAELTFVGDNEVDVHATLTLRVAFNDGVTSEPEPVFDRLMELRRFVREEVVERLTPLY